MSIADKAAGHSVTPSEAGVFVVTSGGSGRVYTVKPVLEGAMSTAECSCEWGRRGRAQDCSHVVAVKRFAAQVLEAK